jgi:hypothetical protein
MLYYFYIDARSEVNLTPLTPIRKGGTSVQDIEVQLIFDTERDHYQWFNVGWKGFNRIYLCLVHFDITDYGAA